MPITPSADAPLAPRTTLGLGGAARWFVAARTDDELREALAWAEERALPVFVLGGGSNVVVADEGHPGLTIAIETRGVREEPARREGGRDVVRVTAAAGERWDELVQRAIERGLAGLECLSGIPGRVGATPVQNVGAYGQEVAQTLARVEVIDRRTGQASVLERDELSFGYRTSALKREPDRWVVTRVSFDLAQDGPPTLAYAELARALADRPRPSLREVRDAVIALRRRKAMVLDPGDPNGRSAGSFFTNPIVSIARADDVVRRARALGLVEREREVPRFVEPGDRVKLAAGWLIEKSGIARGLRRGAVGVSSAHALALVHHGGGTTRELLALASEIEARVRDTFDVTLEREPVLIG